MSPDTARQGLTLLSPSRLLLLLAVAALAVAYVVGAVRRRGYAVRFTNLALLQSVAPRRPGWRRHVPAVVMLLALASLVLSLARPARDERVAQDRSTIMLAIDVSYSMAAEDVAPDRLTAAKQGARAFVDEIPGKVRVGLVAFSGSAQVVVPPNFDRDAMRAGIDRLTLGPSTAIGEAIFASLDAIDRVPSDDGQAPPPARIVLLSDGETTAGRSNEDGEAAARDAGIPVSTIAFGTQDGVLESGGRTQAVPVNIEALRAVADSTGGSFSEATTAEQVRQVYEGLGTSVASVTETREIGRFFVGLGLALALLAGAGSLLWGQRLP